MNRIRHSHKAAKLTDDTRHLAAMASLWKNWTNRRVTLREYVLPRCYYWASPGPDSSYVVIGGPRRMRDVSISLPYEFPSQGVARSVARYMTRLSQRKKARSRWRDHQ